MTYGKLERFRLALLVFSTSLPGIQLIEAKQRNIEAVPGGIECGEDPGGGWEVEASEG
jgi:hypothetical protein